MANVASSPSRTYVAICNRPNWDGHYFRKFTLPMGFHAEGWETEGKGTGTWSEGSGSWVCKNTAEYASWYFLNQLNHVACINGCIPWEQYLDLKDQDELREQSRQLMEAFQDGIETAERRAKKTCSTSTST